MSNPALGLCNSRRGDVDFERDFDLGDFVGDFERDFDLDLVGDAALDIDLDRCGLSLSIINSTILFFENVNTLCLNNPL
jgi:hypothetical protein